MKTKNIIAHSVEEFQNQLQSFIESGFDPSLAIVFSHPTLDNIKVGQILENHKIEFIGCSSAGEIVNGVHYSESISVSLFELDQDSYMVVKQDVEEGQSYEAGKDLMQFAQSKFEKAAFITILTPLIDADQLINALQDASGEEPIIYGGMASDALMNQSYVFTASGVQLESLQTIVFDHTKIAVQGCAIAGWESIGSEYTITKAKNNIIYEINNEPALDFFEKFFGLYTTPSSQAEAVNTINAQYPLQILREGGSVLRAPLGMNSHIRTLSLTGSVKEGEMFKFSIAPSFEVVDQTIEEFNQFKDEIEVPDAMILFSCKARHWAFGPIIDDELEALNQLWNIPYHGFFAFGEIGKNKNKKAQFYNQTCCLVTLKSIQS